MGDVAAELGTTPATILYWMEKYGYRRRDQSASSYAKQNPGGDPFKIKHRLTPEEKELFITGLMLYWSEGAKSQKYSVQLANLDYRMLQIFLEFLRKICRISEEKLRLQVRVYREFDFDRARSYWAELLQIPKKHIAVHPHTDARSKANKQWSPYGIATLQFCNMKLRKWLDEAIEKHVKGLMMAN